ncbi:MAG: PEP-CTERM sorting domain-containing protein [Burkholderiales bacterium]
MSLGLKHRIKTRVATHALVSLLLLGAAGQTTAALISQTQGNSAPGFNDGDVPDVVDLVNAQSGSSPFVGGLGSDLSENGLATWTFNYGAIAFPLVSASLQIGIADHDSAALGSQLSAFTADGGDFTSMLDGLFESGGGAGDGDGQYRIFTLDLSSILPNLADGSASISLELKGPGLLTDIFNNNAEVSSGFNGFFLVFSKLDIVTQDQTPTVPEPGTVMLFGIGALALAGAAHRRKRA